jgi:hypothetical protein
MAIDAGYYGLTTVNFAKAGQAPDHFVLLAGVRKWLEEREDGSGTYHPEVLVSCSARSTPALEWVSASEFLKQRGGFNLLLARPANTVY